MKNDCAKRGFRVKAARISHRKSVKWPQRRGRWEGSPSVPSGCLNEFRRIHLDVRRKDPVAEETGVYLNPSSADRRRVPGGSAK
ncbi:hypothetical protein EYF80_022213 [Liparis tanakae]|uniref:Uncharacterized protein n=1 Tax=Liparis tanakae TaxID=230148 RepID=A0A4Z2HPM2_9TELE|nr:hypothetical protein EYF80_022213 [Liparis tanakae]